jgi:hypothetical protein
MKLLLLRYLLAIDSALLFLLGAVLILVPTSVERAFHFQNLPAPVSYLIGLWGCVLATIAVGYAFAATNPIRYRVWVLVGIFRGLLECALGCLYLARGTVTFQQSGFGITVAGVLALAYVVLYPRKPRLINPANPGPQPAPAAA